MHAKSEHQENVGGCIGFIPKKTTAGKTGENRTELSSATEIRR